MAELVNSVSRLAKRLNVSTRTARRIIEDGALKAHRIGRQWRVFEEDLQRDSHSASTTRSPGLFLQESLGSSPNLQVAGLD
jgi:excisionase family DNA binding protein